MENDDISTLLDELSSFEFPSTSKAKVTHEEDSLTEKTSEQYFLDKTKAIIDAGVSAVQDMTPLIVQSQDAREIDALSKLLAATSQALDVLNKTTLINKKADRDEQLERIKIDAKKELAQLKQKDAATNNNVNFVIASREDVLKSLHSTSNQDVLTIENSPIKKLTNEI